MFNPARLTLARQRRGMNKTALASAVGVTPRSIANYESGAIAPPTGTIAILSSTLGFPETFFSLLRLTRCHRMVPAFDR